MEADARSKPQTTAAEPPVTVRPGRSAGRVPRPFLILGAVVALGLVIVGVAALLNIGHEHTDDAQIEASVVPLAPRVAGTVATVNVLENQKVKKGDLILQIDDADFAALAAQAEAELATARAQAAAAEAQQQIVEATARGGFTTARAQVTSARSEVQSATAQVEAARAALGRAEADARKSGLDLDRIRQLSADGAVSRKDLDDAQAEDDARKAAAAEARAGMAAAEEALNAAKSHVAEEQGKLDASTPVEAQVASARAQAELARAHVKAAEAALDLARLQLSYTRLTAPNDGVVSALTAREGQLLAANQPVANLVQPDVYVVANFKETQVGRMRPGDPARIRVDAFHGRVFTGVVESLAGGTGARFSLLPPDNASGNFVKVVQRVPVRIAFRSPPDVPLRAGMSVNVRVDVRRGA